MSLSSWFSNLFGRLTRQRAVEAEPAAPTWIAAGGAPVPASAGEARIGFGGHRGQGSASVGAARAKLADAFQPSVPTRRPDRFAGRDDVLRRLIEAVEVQRLNVVVYGDRGLGKTSLLHVLGTLAAEGGYLVTYSSCGTDSGFDTVMRQVLDDIPLLHHRDTDPVGDEVPNASFSALLDGEPLEVPRVADLLGRFWGGRLLILLDEFDRAQSDRFRLQIAELIKALSDRGSPVQLVVAGVASNLNELIRHLPSIRRNVTGLPIGPMTEAEVLALVARGAEASGVRFSPDARDELVVLSNGSPYLANLLGQHAGLVATADDRLDVSGADMGAALNRAVDDLRPRLSDGTLKVVESLSPADRARLGQLAHQAMHGTGRIYTAHLDAPSTLKPLLVEAADGFARFEEESAIPFAWLTARLAERR